MKPKDFQVPFPKEAPCVAIADQVWFVPPRDADRSAFSFPGWQAVFGNDNPVHVEYCSGNGAWIANKAEQNPDINWVAVEKKFKRVRKIWSKAKNRNLKNLIVVWGEALDVTSNYFPANSVAHTYINFPDPWPKLRHAKHRLVQEGFLKELHRSMRDQAAIMLVTDDVDYSTQMVDEFTRDTGFSTCYPAPHYRTDLEEYGNSYFETLWREDGRTIRYHRFEKRPST